MLTPEMMELLKNNISSVATCSLDGIPNVGPKGSVRAYDDHTLIYSEGTCRKTFTNIQDNPHVAVMCAERTQRGGFQAKGRARITQSGPEYDLVAKNSAERGFPKPKFVVVIIVEEVFPV